MVPSGGYGWVERSTRSEDARLQDARSQGEEAAEIFRRDPRNFIRR